MSATKYDWQRHGDLEFEDGIESSAFIVDVSEQLWGDATCNSCGEVHNCDCEDRREPYSLEESIERLREFNTKALAWDRMWEYFSNAMKYGDEDTEEDYEMRELMSSIMKEINYEVKE